MSAPCTCTSNCTCAEKGQIAASKPFDSSWTFDPTQRVFYRIMNGQLEEVPLIEVLSKSIEYGN